ncbi:MAG: hypothetical protein V3R94_04770 [Acidobacteriota bacterium]
MLQMNEENFQTTMMEVSQALPEISALFEIDLGDLPTISDILEQAEKALVETIAETFNASPGYSSSSCLAVAAVHSPGGLRCLLPPPSFLASPCRSAGRTLP